MAIITKKQAPVIQPPITYVIELSEEEAQGLTECLSNGVTVDSLISLGIMRLQESLGKEFPRHIQRDRWVLVGVRS
jgi:hypothetical protein